MGITLEADMVESHSEDPKESKNDEVKRFDVEEIDFDVSTSEPVIREAIAKEYSYARLGLITGSLVVAVGALFIVLGYSGAVDITFQAGSDAGHIATGSLGVILAFIGLGILFWTRPKIRTTGKKSNSTSKARAKKRAS